MRSLFSSVNRQPQDAAACRTWLVHLPQDGGARLEQLAALVSDLGEKPQSDEHLLQVAESLRPAHLAALRDLAQPLLGAVKPLQGKDLQTAQAILDGYRMGEGLFAKLHQAAGGDAALASGKDDPSMSVLMLPMARALDYQSRLVIAAIRLGIGPSPSDWDTLCSRARAIRALGLNDIRVLDPASRHHSGTCRESFVSALLVHLASQERLSADELEFATRLASRWAGKVGFIISDSREPSAPLSRPRVELTASSTVQLVSHRLQRRIEESMNEAASSDEQVLARLPGPIKPQSLTDLMTRLKTAWCEPRLVKRDRFASPGRGRAYPVPTAAGA
ncbi:MAG: hypothetical protein VW339_14825, partial [Quisquiliibacterium sp.]